MAKPFIYDKVWIPEEDVDHDVINTVYTRAIYDEDRCRSCPTKPMRHCDACEMCPSYGGTIRLWHQKQFNGKDYIGVPTGDVEKVIDDFGLDPKQIKDKRKKIRFSNDLKFTGKLYTGQKVNGLATANQEKLVERWLAKKKGLINASPRTGKSILAVNIIIRMGYKAIIMADQHDLLRQFYKTFLKFTNLKQLRKETGKRVVDVIEDLSQLDNEHLDVALLNYQKFIRNTGEARIKKYIADKFTTLMVDECHGSAATAYAKFLNSIPMKYKGGLSATPTRKDGRSFIAVAILGRVTVKSTVTAFLPQIKIQETNIKSASQSWHGINNFVATNVPLNEMLAEQVVKDFYAGHECIIIPILYLKQMKLLTNIIEKRVEKERDKLEKAGINLPEKVVFQFWSGVKDRKTVLKTIDAKPFRVMIAVRKMVRQGIDLSRPTMLYSALPTSSGPMFYQLSNRVCTPREGKSQPIVRMFVLHNAIHVACLKVLLNREIFPKIKAGKGRYLMDTKHQKLAMDIIRNPDYAQGGKVAKNKLVKKESVPWGGGG